MLEKFKWFETINKYNFPVYCACGLFMHFADLFYTLCYTFQVVELDATSTQIGICVMIINLTATVLSPVLGWLSEHVNPVLLIRISILLGITNNVILMVAKSISLIYVSCLVFGLTTSIFWPIIQVAVAQEAGTEKQDHKLSIFAFSWSVGRMLGYLFGGILFTALGLIKALILPIVFLAINFIIYPYVTPEKAIMIENRRKARSPAKAIELESQESAKKKKKELTPQEEAIKKAESERITKKIYKWNYIYLIMIYIFNFVAWGVVNTNSSHYLNLAKQFNITLGSFSQETFIGVVMAVLTAGQFSFMFVSGYFKHWMYNRWYILAAHVMFMAAMFVNSFSKQVWLVLIMAFVSGVAVGISHISSSIYSLHVVKSQMGRFAGMSEAMCNFGSFIFPLVGGNIADQVDDKAAPFLFVAGGTCVSLILSEIAYHVLQCFLLNYLERAEAKEEREEKAKELAKRKNSSECDQYQSHDGIIPRSYDGRTSTSDILTHSMPYDEKELGTIRVGDDASDEVDSSVNSEKQTLESSDNSSNV